MNKSTAPGDYCSALFFIISISPLNEHIVQSERIVYSEYMRAEDTAALQDQLTGARQVKGDVHKYEKRHNGNLGTFYETV